jgi:hypothetical protein
VGSVDEHVVAFATERVAEIDVIAMKRGYETVPAAFLLLQFINLSGYS